MNCAIGSANVKILGKAIHSLSKIGDDLYIETLENSLFFRTVNSARSAYVCFQFQLPFFLHYQSVSPIRCKVSLKSCLMAFRSLPALEKAIERCVLSSSSFEDIFLVQFFCRHDVTKAFHLPFIENETVQTSFPDQEYKCKLKASSGLLNDGIQNFSNAVEEVTFSVCENRIILRNYVDDEPDIKKVIHTELKLESTEFEIYDVKEPTEVTFCLKELKAMLNFCEGCNMPITIYCQNSGKPITFTITNTMGIESNFVLATLADQTSDAMNCIVQNCPITSTPTVPHPCENIVNNQSVTVQANNMHETSLEELHNESEQFCHNDNTLEENVGNKLSSEYALNNYANTKTSLAAPPQKKFRSLFLGLSHSSENTASHSSEYTTIAPEPDEILAEASDNEDG